MVTVSSDTTVRVSRVPSVGGGSTVLTGHSGKVTSVSVIARDTSCPGDEFLMATASSDSTVRFWAVSPGPESPGGFSAGSGGKEVYLYAPVGCVSMSYGKGKTGGVVAAAGTADGTVHWMEGKVDAMKSARSKAVHEGPVTAVSLEAPRLYVCSRMIFPFLNIYR